MWRVLILSLVLGALALSGCHRPPSSSSGKFRIALILGKGGLEDKSFNQSAYTGAVQAEKDLGVELRYVEITDDAQTEPTIKLFAEKKFDLIIGIGFEQKEPIFHSAKAFPHQKFAIVDAIVDLPNVASLMFKEQEGSFLAGALAAMRTKTGTIGFVGGMDIPLIRRFQLGYLEGAKYIRKNISILSNFIGVTPEAWNNPTKAKELAFLQMAEGADILFAVAGQSGLGVIDAVEEKSKREKVSGKYFAIGVDSNQNGIKPGFILTSMLKRIDHVVFQVIREAVRGKFHGGVREFDLRDSGIALAIDEYNRPLLSKNIVTEVEKLRKEIVEAKISVTDYYKQKH